MPIWPAVAFALLLAFWATLTFAVMPAADKDSEFAELAKFHEVLVDLQLAFGEALSVFAALGDSLARWASVMGPAMEALAGRSRAPDPPPDTYGDLRARYLLGLYHVGRISWDELERARALDRGEP